MSVSVCFTSGQTLPEARHNTHGFCMSLNMLIEFGAVEGFDFNEWCLEAGFRRTEIMPLLGPSSAAIAYK